MPTANAPSSIVSTASGPAPVIRDLFVCIGAQKAGTTWLARVLASHPDLFMTPVKEIHYFDHVHGLTRHLDDRRRASRRRKHLQKLATQWHRFSEHRSQWAWYRNYRNRPVGDEWYASLFEQREGKRFAGEATPEYAIVGTEGLAHLRRLAPDVRVLFIMRNPVTRAWSQILHHCRSTQRDASRLSLEDLIGVMAEAPNFERLCDYAATLAVVEDVFEPGQVLLMFYEDMHQDRAKALAQVCAHIGIGFDQRTFPELGNRFNRSQDVALSDSVRAHLRQRLGPQAAAVKARLGRVPASWQREFGL